MTEVSSFVSPSGNLLDGVRVLVVDDDPDVLMVLERLLEQAGAVPTLARSTAEALGHLEKSLHDVIVSDISMPGGDGYQLIRRVRARTSSRGGATPAIALTACSSDSDHARAILSGFQVHLSKPIKAIELALSIRRLLSQRFVWARHR